MANELAVDLGTYTPEELINIMNMELTFRDVGDDEQLVTDFMMIAGMSEDDARLAAKGVAKYDKLDF